MLRGGTIFDGSGVEGVDGDLAIDGGRITEIGRGLADGAGEVVDVRGLAVSPGFIDIHSHADDTLFDDPRAESVVRQGVTTVIVGQDGSSSAPARAASGAAGGDRSWVTTAQQLAAVEALHGSVNLATMVGLGTVRAVVIGDENRPATASELGRMVSLVERSLAEGACGASTGLEYTPGAFASRSELIALCRPLAALRLPYATHMRNEDDMLLDAVDEAIGVATGASCPLQISHLKTQGPRNWPKIEAVLERVESAKRGGLDIAFDRYPYVAYQTGLSNLFPATLRDGGTDAFLRRLADPSSAPSMRAAALAKVSLIGGWDNIMISAVKADADRAAEGKRLGSYAASLGAEPYDVAVALLARSRGEVGMAGFAMSEANIARFLAHPLSMVCSDGGAFATDGPAHRGHPHPRGLGSFPRVLGSYVRERRVLTLAQAVHKMTGFPASRARLSDRGRLAPGMVADVVVFDPATVHDRATFEQPFQYPEGIRLVVVNGQIALRDGSRGSVSSGRALRPST